MNNYWDIDEILEEEERIPCDFKRIDQPIPGLGYLEATGSYIRDLDPEAEISMPLWLIKALKLIEETKELLTVQIPACYGSMAMDRLEQEPEIQNLSGSSNNSNGFFENGVKLAPFVPDMRESPDQLVRTFCRRYMDVCMRGLNTFKADTSRLVRNLTRNERIIFEKALEIAIAHKEWKSHDGVCRKAEEPSRKKSRFF
eukprot:TRINITY_DN523009_c0_g1_i1.p1 TRINITY_DN523009_c0_g1~~TRINITY_DN523009_c0_g1_i1.p1  ORF type:complete len:199 (-),score=45.22 TRINITY_DN523009_c0_g1_i1:129-725(-)